MKNLTFVFSFLVMVLTGATVYLKSESTPRSDVHFITNSKKNSYNYYSSTRRSIASFQSNKVYFRPLDSKKARRFRTISSERQNPLADVKIR